jgi:hypothetical protein
MLAFGAHGANPRPAGLDNFFLPAQRDFAYDTARIESIDTRYRAGTGTQTAGLTFILGKRPFFETAVVETCNLGAWGLLVHFYLVLELLEFCLTAEAQRAQRK